jgi:hypothetical protein
MPIEDTLKERGSRYGDFTDHAEIAQAIQDIMRLSGGWGRLTAVQKQALTVIADKQARILSGDPNYTDNWHDIQGYAKLAEDRCQNTDPRQQSIDFKDTVSKDVDPGFAYDPHKNRYNNNISVGLGRPTPST